MNIFRIKIYAKGESRSSENFISDIHSFCYYSFKFSNIYTIKIFRIMVLLFLIKCIVLSCFKGLYINLKNNDLFYIAYFIYAINRLNDLDLSYSIIKGLMFI